MSGPITRPNTRGKIKHPRRGTGQYSQAVYAFFRHYMRENDASFYSMSRGDRTLENAMRRKIRDGAGIILEDLDVWERVLGLQPGTIIAQGQAILDGDK